MRTKIEDKSTYITLNYDYELYNEINKVPESKFDGSDTWTVNNVYAKELFNQLQKLNADVSSMITTINNKIGKHESYYTYINKEKIKTVQIKVLKENEKSINFTFDFDENVLKIIKDIEREYRRFNPNNKTWSVRKEQVNWLYNKLESLGYVEVSDLSKFTSKNEEYIHLSEDDFQIKNRKPYKFQLETAEKMVNYKKVINALEAGLGKTMTAIMCSEKIGDKTLIVCPATVKENWKKEIHIVNEHADVNVLDAKDEWKSAHYVILNYDIIDRFYDDIMNEGFNIFIMDEAHKIRGVNGRGEANSKRAKYCLSIAEQMEYVYPITATPFINYTKDIFNLLVAIDHPSTQNWYAFANSYCGAERGDFGVSYNGSSNQEQLYERLYPNYMIRLLSEDHLDLPERVRSFVPLKINLKKYEREVEKYLSKRNSLESNGEHLVYMNAMRMKLAEEKAKHSVKLIKDYLDQNESVVVFTNYTNVVESLFNKFENDAVYITGDTNSKDRQKYVDVFQSGEKKVFIGNIDAAGEGITLTKSHHMIVIDFHWSPVVMVNQMEKRIHRISQLGTAKIEYLYGVGAKLDEMLVEMLDEKLNNASSIIDGTKQTFTTDLIKKL